VTEQHEMLWYLGEIFKFALNSVALNSVKLNLYYGMTGDFR